MTATFRHPVASAGSTSIGDGPELDRGRSGWLPDPLVDGPAASCDLLVEVIDTIRTIDRLTAKATGLLEHAQLTGEIEEQTGLAVEVWLSAAGRRTRADRRMLTTTAELRTKLPSLAEAFDAGKVSWAQVRSVVCACAKLPQQLLAAVDDALGPEIESLIDAEPDALIHVVSRAVSSVEDRPDAKQAARQVRDRFLAIQPRLDGTGGSIYGEADAYGLAVLSEALDAGTPPPAGRNRDHLGQDTTADERRRQRAMAQGRRRMDALIAMAETSLFSGTQPGRTTTTGHGQPQTQGFGGTVGVTAPKLLLTMSYETLVGLSNQPGELLTTLTGGHLKLPADTARRLVDKAGVHLRTIVLEDTGQILGVGRRNYRPPGWLRDATLVRDQTCRAPNCLTAARLCDLDHADPWTPDPQASDGPGVGGPTDIINLAHLCRTDHGAKDRDGWHVYGHPDRPRRGLHRWTHQRTGLTIDTIPATRKLHLPTTPSDSPRRDRRPATSRAAPDTGPAP